jgi:hypothetical protein
MRRLLMMALFLAACGEPTEEAVRANFLQEYPRAVIASAVPGEGDSDHVYYHVRFRQPPDTTLREVVRGYQRTSARQWRVFHRDSGTNK